jgi:hypothetical protein
VHEVGDFVASFVPTQADFGRLDRQFRLSDAVWSSLPHYADHGFAVFQLKDLGAGGFFSWIRGRGRAPSVATIHPMAFEYQPREPDRLFFPTVHVHDGKVHEHALFDHDLYAQFQLSGAPGTPGWRASDGPVGHRVDSARARGVIDCASYCYKRSIHGRFRNQDVTVSQSAL